ncbi:MAG: hypothetical protein ABI619_10025 [Betaproteobacteria bacterium]
MFEWKQQRMCIFVPVMAISSFVWLASGRSGFAHGGPPFPILMDESLANHRVSVWADPDIGEAAFFIVVESPLGGPPTDVPTVSMWYEPASGRSERVVCEAKQETLRNQLQFAAKPYFDQRDMWTVGFRLATADGRSEEVTTQIESTPPGFGPWDLLIYLFPFLLIGGMWVLAMVRRGRMERSGRANAESTAGESQREQRLVETKAEQGA